jgi:uncharacterized protein (PEP-CTERM system associated)
VWTYSDARDVATSFDQQRLGSLGTAYDLMFLQLASVEPDPIRRDLLVRLFLRDRGIDPNQQILSTFLVDALTVQRQQALSFALVGLRTTVTFGLSRSDGRRLDSIAGVVDPFSTSTRIRTTGLATDVSHRLTANSTLGAAYSRQRSEGDATIDASTLESVSVRWSARLGVRTTASLGARYATLDGGTSPYDERAVFGSLGLQF